MTKYYSIKIPEPCHEGWDNMTPKDKGRFCNTCNKTVVDFTKMDTYQIQDFLIEHKNQRICGHIKQSQLDSINLKIPLQIIQQKHNVYKSFFFAVMIVMGTSLFSCTSETGRVQKIDSIEIVDTTKNKVIDVLGGISSVKKDSIIDNRNECNTAKQPNNIIEGDIILGAIIPTTEPYYIYQVDQHPKFKNTPQQLSKKNEKKYFQQRLSEFIKTNFKTSNFINLGLQKRQKIYVLFEIDQTGKASIKKIRSAHYLLENEAKRVFEKLPDFIPAKLDDKSVSVKYNLPIVFNIEE